MSLFKKIFGGDRATQAGGPVSSQFHESEATTGEEAGNAPRRELVQVVLRDTMRRHGVPSDWIECRILSVVSRRAHSGMHVCFIVRQGHQQMLTYVPAFQTSFMRAIEQFEPRAGKWLFSLSWQFEGIVDGAYPAMPGTGIGSPARDTGEVALDAVDDELAADLQALYAIRDAAIKPPEPARPDPPDFEPTAPGR